MAVSFAGPERLDRGEIVRRFQVEEVPVGKSVRSERVLVFRVADASGDRLLEIIAEISRLEGIRHVGLVTAFREDSVAFVANEFVVKFQPSVDAGDVLKMTSNLRLTIRRPIPYAGNAFLLHARDPLNGLAACDELIATGKVEYAEPNLVVTAQDDQPTRRTSWGFSSSTSRCESSWCLGVTSSALNGQGSSWRSGRPPGSEHITIGGVRQGSSRKRSAMSACPPDWPAP